jgi:hypothetical protein
MILQNFAKKSICKIRFLGIEIKKEETDDSHEIIITNKTYRMDPNTKSFSGASVENLSQLLFLVNKC